MKNPFLKKMLAAGRLTGRGSLAEATAVIQRALAASFADKATPAARTSRAAPAAAGPVVVAERVSPATDAADVKTAPGRFLPSSFTGASGTRSFKLFTPSGFDGQRLPLVVMLHGCTQSPDDFAAGTGMNALAQRHGLIVLYPEQAARSNAHRCWNWFSPGDQQRGQGEPALIAGMTRHVMQTAAVDADRVYVAGLSAGGAMAAILAREYNDLYAAAGVHSGLPPGAAHDVGSAFAAMKSGARAARGTALPAKAGAPLVVFHGSADTTVAPANGDAVVAAALAAWPHAARTVEESGRGARRPWKRTVWKAGEAGASVVEQWVVAGAPHAWSGGSAAGSYTDPDGPDASDRMLRFFFEHRLSHAA